MRPDSPRELGVVVQRTDTGPLNDDWRWQPAGWHGDVRRSGDSAGPGITLFHDDPAAKMAGTATEAGLDIDLTVFAGTFLSIAVDLPADARAGLAPWHQISADLAVNCSGFLRLNLKFGNKTVTRLTAVAAGRGWAGLDLDRAFSDGWLADHAWLDVIAEDPSPGLISIRLFELRRHPRPAM